MNIHVFVKIIFMNIHNEILMKCFRILHLSERQGMGGSEIFKIASDNKRLVPNIDTNLMTTELTIWKVDIAELPDLSDREKTVLRYIANAGRAVTSKELLEQLPQYKRTNLHQCLTILQERGLIQKKGASVSTNYVFCPKSLNRISSVSKEAQVFMDVVRRGHENK